MPTKERRTFRFVLLLAVLAAPRLARMAYPQVWIEDESYLNAAFLLSRGFLPYRDFPLPHLPALEAALALVFRAAPVSIRTAEVITQIAAFMGSVLVFVLGRRIAGGLTGGLAALIFATSALLFRYHVFEREVFVVVPVMAAVLAVSGPARRQGETSAGVAAGLLLAGALMIKLTAIAALAALAFQLWVEGRRRSAAIMAITALGLLSAAFVGLGAVFGTPFIVQVLMFRLVHAVFPSVWVKLDELRYTLDVSLAAGIGGTILILWSGQWRNWLAPMTQLLCGLVFLVLLNPAYWAHTGIELLPWLSLPGGYLLASSIECWRPAAVGRLPEARTRNRGRAFTQSSNLGRIAHRDWPSRAQTLVSLAAAILVLLEVAPIRNLNWEAGDGSVYGFGYRDRRELEMMGRFVGSHAAVDAPVATPGIIAFVANRREAIPYAEIAGEIDELSEIVRGRRSVAVLTDRSLRSRSFWDTVEASRDRMRPVLEDGLKSHRIAVVIDDSPDDLMPVRLTDVSQETLEAYGYGLEFGTPHYDAWVPR